MSSSGSSLTTGPIVLSEYSSAVSAIEELSAAPFVNVIAQGGKAIGVSLTNMSKATYFGSFTISDATPTGQALVTFSGRDMAGNRGTSVSPDYKSFIIDSQGPKIIALTLNPLPPMNNDPQATVDLALTLDDGPLNDPEVFYQINEEDPIAVNNLATQGIDRLTWTATFTLPASAVGTPNVGDALTISFRALDYNVSHHKEAFEL